MLLRLPLVGRLVRAANTARATHTLALLAGSAVPLLDALGIAAQVVPNLPMREALRGAAFKVREGSAFSRALGDSGQFPPVALRLIASGERSGELPRMLEEAAQQQQRELDRWMTALTAVLGPAVILLVGFTAIGVAAGVGMGALMPSAMPFDLEAAPIAIASLLTIVLGIIGAGVAVLRISRVDPITALGGQR